VDADYRNTWTCNSRLVQCTSWSCCLKPLWDLTSGKVVQCTHLQHFQSIYSEVKAQYKLADFQQPPSNLHNYALHHSIMSEEETYSGIVSIYVMHKRSLVWSLVSVISNCIISEQLDVTCIELELNMLYQKADVGVWGLNFIEGETCHELYFPLCYPSHTPYFPPIFPYFPHHSSYYSCSSPIHPLIASFIIFLFLLSDLIFSISILL